MNDVLIDRLNFSCGIWQEELKCIIVQVDLQMSRTIVEKKHNLALLFIKLAVPVFQPTLKDSLVIQAFLLAS